MTPKVQAVPWATVMEKAATDAGISQGKTQSEGSVDDATTSVTSSYMHIINEYLSPLMNEITADARMNPSEKRSKRMQVEVLSKGHYEVVSNRIADLIYEKYNLGAGDE